MFSVASVTLVIEVVGLRYLAIRRRVASADMRFSPVWDIGSVGGWSDDSSISALCLTLSDIRYSFDVSVGVTTCCASDHICATVCPVNDVCIWIFRAASGGCYTIVGSAS